VGALLWLLRALGGETALGPARCVRLSSEPVRHLERCVGGSLLYAASARATSFVQLVVRDMRDREGSGSGPELVSLKPSPAVFILEASVSGPGLQPPREKAPRQGQPADWPAR